MQARFMTNMYEAAAPDHTLFRSNVILCRCCLCCIKPGLVLLHREPQSIQNPRPYTEEHQAPKAIQMDSGHYQDPAYEQPEMQEPDAEDAWRRVQLSGSGFRV